MLNDLERKSMAERSPGAYVVRRRLGTALRKYRESANVRIEAAARELECSPAKISRLENGQGPAKLWDVRILMTFYGVEDAGVRDQLENWARGSKSESWWESDADLTTDDLDRYLAAETEAGLVRLFCTPVVPALLQTTDYAEAHIRGLFPAWPDADIKRFVDVRRERQTALTRVEKPLSFEGVIDEAALLRQVGTESVHRAQLESLITQLGGVDDQGRRTVTLRILPLTAGPGRGLSPFTIFEPRDPVLDPRTAYIEETTGGSWVEEGHVAELAEIYDELLGMSMAPDPSLIRLREIIRSL
jgi:transcriptional regulator with XRE-family HTH domain